MAGIDSICREVLGDVDGAIACATVDVNTGLMLGSAHNVPNFSQQYLDAVAAASVEMFNGKNVKAVEKLLSSQRDKPASNSIKEMQMTTDGTFHFMAIIPEKPNVLVVLVTTKKANLGMGWVAVRAALSEVYPYCP
jgi:hypothetical protein